MNQFNNMARLMFAFVVACGDASDHEEDAWNTTGSGEASDRDGELGITSEALVTKGIPCGSYADFPTWSFWGVTTLALTNETKAGTTIHALYQAGVGGSVDVYVADREQTQARWGGVTLYVTYLGWEDVSGYHACSQGNPPAEAPKLLVQTY